MSMQNPNFPLVPAEHEEPDLATTEVDGDQVLDADADPNLIDSADADRLAAEEGDDDPDEP